MRKISRWEQVLLGVTAAVILVMLGFFWGRSTAGEQYTISGDPMPTGSPASSVSPLPAAPSDSPSPSAPADTDMPVDTDMPADTPAPLSEDGKININTATAQELEELPYIGEVRARAIVEERERGGPFLRVEDITRVSGIGEGILERIRDHITV